MPARSHVPTLVFRRLRAAALAGDCGHAHTRLGKASDQSVPKSSPGSNYNGDLSFGHRSSPFDAKNPVICGI